MMNLLVTFPEFFSALKNVHRSEMNLLGAFMNLRGIPANLFGVKSGRWLGKEIHFRPAKLRQSGNGFLSARQ